MGALVPSHATDFPERFETGEADWYIEGSGKGKTFVVLGSWLWNFLSSLLLKRGTSTICPIVQVSHISTLWNRLSMPFSFNNGIYEISWENPLLKPALVRATMQEMASHMVPSRDELTTRGRAISPISCRENGGRSSLRAAAGGGREALLSLPSDDPTLVRSFWSIPTIHDVYSTLVLPIPRLTHNEKRASPRDSRESQDLSVPHFSSLCISFFSSQASRQQSLIQ